MKQKVTIKTINKMLDELKENRVSFQDIKEEMRELDEKVAETSSQLQETSIWFQETREIVRQTTEQMKETDRKINKLSDLYNGFAKNAGEAVEEYFYRYFESCKQIGDIHFDIVQHPLSNMKVEYDIALMNGEYFGIIECKHKFHPNDLKKFVETMLPRFKTEFPNYRHLKIIAGIASYILPQDTINLAIENGLYIFTQSGEDVKILNDTQFVPTIF